MTLIDQIETAASHRIVRTANGGIDYDHYRSLALRRRERALAAAFRRVGHWLRSMASGPVRERTMETDWRVDAARGA
ncbi:MAG: hypothetical protein ACRCTI_10610 [Beijerinckiaceae bacterium]